MSEAVLGVDPGTTESGYCLFDGRVLMAGTIDNKVLHGQIRSGLFGVTTDYVFEKIQSYGRPVGKSTFETLFWTGRMFEAAVTVTEKHTGIVARIPFPEVKQHLCRSTKGKDADVRLALCARYGGEKSAKGTKAAPGPLRGVSGHAWSALAIAAVWWDRSAIVRQAARIIDSGPVLERIKPAEVAAALGVKISHTCMRMSTPLDRSKSFIANAANRVNKCAACLENARNPHNMDSGLYASKGSE